MQIGFPTDVKHVAHIGWDGPSTNTPSWVYCIHFLSSLPSQFIHCYEPNQFRYKAYFLCVIYKTMISADKGV